MADEIPEMPPLSSLPENCIANIISFTSPGDAGRAAVISSGFKSAAESDTVWERFIPLDHGEIFSGSSSTAPFATKKELFFSLCDSPQLIDGGKLSFKLSRSTGKRCYMMSTRELQGAWVDDPDCWEWKSLPESRFAEVVEQLGATWLEIHGKMNAEMLSPNTNYSAYLVFKLAENHLGLDCPSTAWASFVEENRTHIETERSAVYMVLPTSYRGRKHRRWPRFLPGSRTDGWLEVKLAEFFIGEGDRFEVNVKLLGDDDYQKKGLIVEGIELRPK